MDEDDSESTIHIHLCDVMSTKLVNQHVIEVPRSLIIYLGEVSKFID